MQLSVSTCAVYGWWWPPYPFLFAWLWNPSWFFSFPQSTYWIFCSCLHLNFSSAPCREEEGLAAGKGPVLSATLLDSGCQVNRGCSGLVSLILLQFRAQKHVQCTKKCTVHMRLLVKVWWHGNLSLLFWGGGHYPNGLHIVQKCRWPRCLFHWIISKVISVGTRVNDVWHTTAPL